MSFLSPKPKTSGEGCGPGGADGKALEDVGGGEVGVDPGAPEVGDDGEHGAGVEHDEEQRHLRGGGVEMHQLFGDDDVGGAGDRQQFGKALHDGKEDDVEEAHEDILAGGW